MQLKSPGRPVGVLTEMVELAQANSVALGLAQDPREPLADKVSRGGGVCGSDGISWKNLVPALSVDFTS